MRRGFVELRAVGSSYPGHITRKFDRRALHAETEAEKRHLPFPRISNRGNFAFDPPCSEPARNQNPVSFAQNSLGPLPLDILRFNPTDIHLGLMVDPAMYERLAKTLVTLLEPGIFSDQRDGNFVFGPLDFLYHRIPFTQIRLTGFQVQLSDDQFVQSFLPKHDRHFVNRIDVFRRDDRILLHVAKHGDLPLEFRG